MTHTAGKSYLLRQGELKVESGSAWLAGVRWSCAGGRKEHGQIRLLDILRITRRASFPKSWMSLERLTIAGLEYFCSRSGGTGEAGTGGACDYLALLDIRGKISESSPIETRATGAS